ncbi:MAG TPA: class I SAM-dependent methyltransferase [Candidatus Baltobacteraceae bacterium]|nr:class I SAM-dependent methyltransferase [Candidatus Baltobacteraceae bacterium]
MKRSGQRFDATYGVTTEGVIFLGDLDPDAVGDALADATHYEPTPVADFEALIGALPVPLRELVFVDVGSGLGRAVLLASRHPFKQVVGVEVSPALCEIARDNLVRWRRSGAQLACKDLRIICSDAAHFAFPPGDLAVYLYNPFGEASVERLADRLAARPSNAFVLYHTPVHRAAFDVRPEYREVADVGAGVVYRTVPKGPQEGLPRHKKRAHLA